MLTEEAPFSHVLNLFIVTSPQIAEINGIHCATEHILEQISTTNPLQIDFYDWKILKKAVEFSEQSVNAKVRNETHASLIAHCLLG